VLFVIDVSGSMSWPERSPRRIDVARDELGKVLGQLGPKTDFNLIVFAFGVRAWRKGEVAATSENVRKAIEWAGQAMARPVGGTNTSGALETAFTGNERFDTVFFLSDGSPTVGRLVAPEAIEAGVRAWNRYRRVAIHTIALTLEEKDDVNAFMGEDPRLMKAFMRNLAAATGGASKVVVRPPG